MYQSVKYALVSLVITTSPASAITADEPSHMVVSEDGAIQIRDYDPMILAEVDVRGNLSGAGNSGFRPLANYIFGGNQARDGGNAEIAMTTPVTQTRSQEIAMTTPVTQSQSEPGQWRVAFVMPPEWTIESLPIPEDANVTLREQPARRMAVIRFSGGARDSRFAEKENELRIYLNEQNLEIVGEAVFARYDPPWIPTPFRRNEVMLEIKE
jgi:hypothetical protein